MSFTIDVARRFGHLASNLVVAGLGDHLALPHGPSSEVNPESGSICRFNSSRAGGISRSSRSSASLRSCRLASIFWRPGYPSICPRSTSGDPAHAEPSALLEISASPESLFPTVHFRVPEQAEMPHIVSVDQFTPFPSPAPRLAPSGPLGRRPGHLPCQN